MTTKPSNDIVYFQNVKLQAQRLHYTEATVQWYEKCVWHISTVSSTIADPSAYNSEGTKEWPLPEKRTGLLDITTNHSYNEMNGLLHKSQ